MKNNVEDLKNLVAHTIDNSTSIDQLKNTCRLLLNKVEELFQSNLKLSDEVSSLRDEINRLKGEKGKPKFKAKNKRKNISSEKERKEDKQSDEEIKSKAKNADIKISRKEILEVDKSQLPLDAIFKGYQKVIVQDIKIVPENIEFWKKVYHSKSLGKSIIAELPDGYYGEFGPGIKSLILSLSSSSSNMTQSAIVDFLSTHDIDVSSSTISRIILSSHAQFEKEKLDIIASGLSSTDYQHIDDTGARVNGENCYLHILCNEFYTAYFTRSDKSRLTVLKILCGGNVTYRFDENAYSIMQDMKLSAKAIKQLRAESPGLELSESQVKYLLDKLYYDGSHETSRRIIMEASSISM